MTSTSVIPSLTNACVQCGYCCTVLECSYGKWDIEHNRCTHLTEDNLCAIYDEIVEKEKNSQFPMIGSGCSSTLFNDVREAKIKKMCEERGY